jgi:hypothetical protein
MSGNISMGVDREKRPWTPAIPKIIAGRAAKMRAMDMM